MAKWTAGGPGGAGGGTQITVDGAPVDSYDFDTTPVAPGELTPPAYSKTEVDGLFAAGGAFLGISAFDVGNIETLTRAPGFNDKTLGSGTLWVQKFICPRTTNPIVRLGYPTRGTAPAGITLARMALFTVAANENLTMVARTASFTPAGTYTDQVNDLSTVGGYPSSYTLQVGQRYALGLLLVGTTPGTAHGWDIPGAGNKPFISARVTGQTDIAASYTNAQQAGHFEGLYLFGRHATG